MPSDRREPFRLPMTPDPAATAGHFPGRPVVPGVALLDGAWRALKAAGVATGRPARLRGVRFQRTVGPGEALLLEGSLAGGGVRFVVRSETAPVARGFLGAAEGAGLDPVRSVAATIADLPPLDALLPHRPPMRLVEGVTGFVEDGVRCRVVVPPDCPLARGGPAPGLALVEMAAQAAAVHGALTAPGGDASARPGAIVGLPEVELRCTSFPAGVPFEAVARLEERRPPVEVYRGTVLDGAGVLLAEGVLWVVGSLGDPVSHP